jgi:hypothetical protein
VLPVYMRGGIISQGLGNLLGNALALLFVARHGLKEGELLVSIIIDTIILMPSSIYIYIYICIYIYIHMYIHM